MNHLDTLNLRLSNELARLMDAKSDAEIAQRRVWVAQIQREIAGEGAFTSNDLSDDDLLSRLND